MLGFDELTIIKTTQKLYDDLDRENKKVFTELSQMVYEETTPHGAAPPDRSWILALLALYNPVTGYIYENEVKRKLEYATESIVAKGTKEFRRALRYWSDMTAQYSDIVVNSTMQKAYEDAGVKKVRWVTEQDERVCSICKKRSGKVYDLDKVPPPPHWKCRCWLEPVT